MSNEKDPQSKTAGLFGAGSYIFLKYRVKFFCYKG